MFLCPVNFVCVLLNFRGVPSPLLDCFPLRTSGNHNCFGILISAAVQFNLNKIIITFLQVIKSHLNLRSSDPIKPKGKLTSSLDFSPSFISRLNLLLFRRIFLYSRCSVYVSGYFNLKQLLLFRQTRLYSRNTCNKA